MTATITATATRPVIQVVLAARDVPATLTAALHRIGASAVFSIAPDVLRQGFAAAADAVVIVTDASPTGCDTVTALLARSATRTQATLVMCPDDAVAQRAAAAIRGTAACVATYAETDLAERIAAIVPPRHAEWTAAVGGPASREDESRASEIHAHLRLAAIAQKQFLPTALPTIAGFSFAALYQPAEFVSGDVYDVRQLDAEHVAIAIADAGGSGLFSALLTVFLKRALIGRERGAAGYRVLPPSEILARLNDELLEADLRECRFVSAAYALLNTRTRCLSLARAGAPYPILRRAAGATLPIRTAGGVAGVFPGAAFEMTTLTLAPGDGLLLHTDGLERVVFAGETPQPAAAAPRPRRTLFSRLPQSNGVEPLAETSWYRSLERDGVSAAIDDLARRHDALRQRGARLDDLTVLAVHAHA